MSPTMNSSSILRVSVGVSWLSRWALARDSAWAAMDAPYPWKSHVKPPGARADRDNHHAPSALTARRRREPGADVCRDRRMALRSLAGQSADPRRLRLRGYGRPDPG